MVSFSKKSVFPIVATIVVVFLSTIIGFQVFLTFKLSRVETNVASTTAALTHSMKLLDEKLAQTHQKGIETSDTLYAEQQRIVAIEEKVGGFEKRVGKISGTVSTLEKLKNTDPELLQKYSKVFFLNEHYTPPRLVQINNKYVYSENQTHRIHVQVLPYLTDMIDDALKDGITLYVKSAYRSFDEQANIKSSYSVTYGAGTANTFSADQGYSEHQLGTTVDFISTGQGGVLEGFDKTPAYQWLLQNAHKYGFVLSYPQNNAYYIFEPWHWRFVGTELAKDLHDDNKYFYELEQRKIDEYLAEIFD